MQVKWKILFVKSIIWLLAELCLNFLELDNLADYGEFVFERNVVVFLGKQKISFSSIYSLS